MCLDDGRVVSNFVAQVWLPFLPVFSFFFSGRGLYYLFPCYQAIRKQPMTVYGDGKQTRSFQYVSDLV